MAEEEKDDWGPLTPEEMRGWYHDEVMMIRKEAELRIKDADAFVSAYERGELSPEEASHRNYEYSNRWGDALPGTFGMRNLTDEQILMLRDAANEGHKEVKLLRERIRAEAAVRTR